MDRLELDLCNTVVELKQIHPDWGRKRIADQIGCTEGQVRTILSKYKKGTLDLIVSAETTLAEDLKLQKYKKEINTYRKKYLDVLQKVEELEEQLTFSKQLENIKEVLVPTKFEVPSKEPGEAVAVVLAGDWHIDEVVDGSAIGGVNEFNLGIARTRAKKFFEYTVRLLRMCKSESKINTLVLGALGDFITGWIHEEFLSSNSMTPPEAIVELFELLSGGIKFLLDEGDIENLIFVGVCGNHSRITKKNQSKNSPKKSFEWPVYNYLAKWFANSEYKERIKFKLPTGYFNYLTILNKAVRFHHGDGIRYAGGTGGVHIPLRRAIAQWNKARHVDLDILGHWHTREPSRDYVINGSLIGFNEYAERIKADFEPPQQSFFIIHPKFGKTAEFPIVLE